jgi:hypothetical protein
MLSFYQGSLGFSFITSEQGINDRLDESLCLVQIAGFCQIIADQFAADCFLLSGEIVATKKLI